MRCSSAASRPSSARRKSSGICSIRPTRPTSIPAGVGPVREREQEEAARGRDPHHPPGPGRGRARRRVPARRGAADARARGERPAAPGRLGRARPRLPPRRPHRSPDPAVAADAVARGRPARTGDPRGLGRWPRVARWALRVLPGRRQPVPERRRARPAHRAPHGEDAGEPGPHADLRGAASRLAHDARALHSRRADAAAARSARPVAVRPVQALSAAPRALGWSRWPSPARPTLDAGSAIFGDVPPRLRCEELGAVQKGLVVGFLAAAIWYLTWRPSAFNFDALGFSAAVYAAELFGCAVAALHLYMCWRLPVRDAPAPRPGLTVDVFVTTYNEPGEMIRRTLLAARNMEYPHQTWLLDDGNRPELRKLAAELDRKSVA